MPALTITAVVNGTNTLTIVGHGLVTGDGPAAVRNIGGALPDPLAGVTDYWIIRDSDDDFRLADSSANALLGTAINLTTDGTGTNLLEIGIPYRRARTYAVSSQLRSADLNAMQDALEAMHAVLTDQAQSIWSAPALNPDTMTLIPLPFLANNWAWAGASIIDSSATFVSSNAGNAEFCLSDYMRAGQRLATVRLWLEGDGAVDVTAYLAKTDYAVTPAPVVLDTQVESNVASGSYTFLDLDADDEIVGQLTNRFWLRAEASAAGAVIHAIILIFTP